MFGGDFKIAGKPNSTFADSVTAKQTQKELNKIKSLINDPSMYNLYNNNCATVAQDILHEAGVAAQCRFEWNLTSATMSASAVNA